MLTPVPSPSVSPPPGAPDWPGDFRWPEINLIGWLSSPAWAGVSGIAAIVALAALVIALLDFQAKRRRMEGISWDFDGYATGTVTDDSSPSSLEILKMSQLGLSNAQIVTWSFVKCQPFKSEDYDLPRHLASGQTCKLALRVDVPVEAWFIVSWIDLADKRWLHAEWFPVADTLEGSRVAAKYDSQPQRRPWSRFFPKPRPVGPTGVGYARAKLSSSRSSADDLVTMISLASHESFHVTSRVRRIG